MERTPLFYPNHDKGRYHMKLYDLCKLCESVARLNKLSLSFPNARRVRDLYKKLQYDVEFYCQEEEKVICSFISAGNARREGSKLIFDQLPEKKTINR